MQKNKKTISAGFSGNSLKLIAMVTMLIDHIGASFLAGVLRYMNQTGIEQSVLAAWYPNYSKLYYLYWGLRMVGRISFPLFAFLLVEGFYHTHSVKRYAGNLAVFALLSEIPFDLAFDGVLFSLKSQNIFWTLLLGLITITALDRLRSYSTNVLSETDLLIFCHNRKMISIMISLFVLFITTVAAYKMLLNSIFAMAIDKIGFIITVSAGISVAIVIILKISKQRTIDFLCFLQIATVSCACLLAELMYTDYAGWGVLTIVIFYLLHTKTLISAPAGVVTLCLQSVYELPALFAIPLITHYNGTRGIRLKYFFYIFYPVHLLVLYTLLVCLGIRTLPI